SAISFGENFASLGLRLDASAAVDVTSEFDLRFSFGFDLTPGLSEDQAGFVRVQHLTFGVHVHATGVSAGVNVGLLAAQIHDRDASASATLANPDHDPQGNLPIREMNETALADLVSVSATGSLAATLPVSAHLGTYTAAGSPTISVSAPNVFAASAPAVTTSD